MVTDMPVTAAMHSRRGYRGLNGCQRRQASIRHISIIATFVIRSPERHRCLFFFRRLERDRYALFGMRLLTVRLRGPQRQLVLPNGKTGWCHYELTGSIGGDATLDFAITQ